jgi:hypothetical protein
MAVEDDGDFRFGKPGSGKPRFVKNEHEGHLVAFCGIIYQPDVPTVFGDSDAAAVETIVCLDCLLVLTDQLVFGTVLVERLCSAHEKDVLIRLARGKAKPGRAAPWIPEDPLPGDEKVAGDFFERHAQRLENDRIVISAELDESGHIVDNGPDEGLF